MGGFIICGAGEIRTLVQTRNQEAFYKFILLLVFEYKPEVNTQFIPYPIQFRQPV